MTAIPGEIQHMLVVEGVDKKRMEKVVRKMHNVRSDISLLRNETMKCFDDSCITNIFLMTCLL